MNKKFDYVFDRDKNSEWAGLYKLATGEHLYCEEYVGCDHWEVEWYGSILPDGAVYYEIYDNEVEVDGGVMGYMYGDSFGDFLRFIEPYTVTEKVSEPDWY